MVAEVAVAVTVAAAVVMTAVIVVAAAVVVAVAVVLVIVLILQLCLIVKDKSVNPTPRSLFMIDNPVVDSYKYTPYHYPLTTL